MRKRDFRSLLSPSILRMNKIATIKIAPIISIFFNIAVILCFTITPLSFIKFRIAHN